MFSLSGPAAATDVKISCLFCLLITLLLFVSPGGVRAQGGTDSLGTGGKHTIQGRIFFPSGRQADVRAKVQLEGTNIASLYVIADTDGSFRFRGIGPGSYTLVINAGEEYEVARESVFIEGPSGLGRNTQISSQPRVFMVPIYLQYKRSKESEAKLGVVNAALANVPKAAVDLYLGGLQAAQANDSKKAIEKLRAAVSLYPNFPFALNELGVQYLKVGQPDKAAEALRAAVDNAPNDFTPHLNYGIALLEKRDFAQAESELLKAVKINDSVPTAHMYLGLALLSQRRYSEGEKELQRAVTLKGGENLALAHKYLGGLYWKNNQYKQAAVELETYLKLEPQASDADKIRATIKELRDKQNNQ